jgi:hypothetical protein
MGMGMARWAEQNIVTEGADIAVADDPIRWQRGGTAILVARTGDSVFRFGLFLATARLLSGADFSRYALLTAALGTARSMLGLGAPRTASYFSRRVSHSWPFTKRADVFFLSIFRMSSEIGAYAVAYTLAEAFWVVTDSLEAALFVDLARRPFRAPRDAPGAPAVRRARGLHRGGAGCGLRDPAKRIRSEVSPRHSDLPLGPRSCDRPGSEPAVLLVPVLSWKRTARPRLPRDRARCERRPLPPLDSDDGSPRGGARDAGELRHRGRPVDRARPRAIPARRSAGLGPMRSGMFPSRRAPDRSERAALLLEFARGTGLETHQR